MTTLLICKIGTRLASASRGLIVVATLGQLAGCASLLSDGAASFSCPADAQGLGRRGRRGIDTPDQHAPAVVKVGQRHGAAVGVLAADTAIPSADVIRPE